MPAQREVGVDLRQGRARRFAPIFEREQLRAREAMTPARPIPASPPEAPVAWHALPVTAVAAQCGTSIEHGLASAEAVRRLGAHGSNELRAPPRRSPAQILLGQFTDFMILLLIGAAIVSGVVGDAQDALAIVAIVILNAVIGFVQEYRAEKALRALQRMAALQARVLRDGAVDVVPAAELVTGDVVLLETGSIVPADLRLVEAALLGVEEAALTGESTTVEKSTAALPDADTALPERVDMVYSGTIVAGGRGRGVVVATGMATELGRIAALLAATEEAKTPLQRRLARFGRQLSAAAIAVCVAVFALGVARGESVALMFLTAVSLAVAAVPEALPAVITIALALGAQRLVRTNALIRRLPAVETLGSVTCICSDKTGTLTQNRMRVDAYFVEGEVVRALPPVHADEPWSSLLMALALCNDAQGGSADEAIGDPTETALLAAAAAAGYDKAALERLAPRVAEIPFDAERKCMTTLHAVAASGLVAGYTKGAPERVIERCTRQAARGSEAPLDSAALVRTAERMAGEGLRVLGLARREFGELPAELTPAEVERDLVFVGFVGLIDPPRPEARQAVADCHDAGIDVVMITGDHPLTARTVAQRLGILGERDDRVVSGRQLAGMNDAELAARVGEIRVYARVDPAQKIRIVAALQARGAFVAMTGDGVNDAPALKRADIGVAMGRIGTDVAREASAMVLLDDNFATIVAAVREGRRIYGNIRKFIKFVLAGNTGEILTLLVAPLAGLPLPLSPIQILWVNLLTDGLPGLALAAEPEEKGNMRRPPRPPGESFFAGGLGAHVVWVGCLIGGLTVAAQAVALGRAGTHWQTIVFTVLAFAQLFHVIAIRSDESLFAVGLRSNLPLAWAVLAGVALQLAAIYVPAANAILGTRPLTAAELALCVTVPGLVFVAVEIEKWLARRN
jgi:Ca2+-transporting ATPase